MPGAAAAMTHVEAGVEEHAGGEAWRTRRAEEQQALFGAGAAGLGRGSL